MKRLILIALGALMILLGVGLFVAYATAKPPAGQLAIKLFSKPTVMPAASKVYGNPQASGGRYWLSKAVFENTGTGPIRNLEVSFSIPDYIEWTTPEHYPEVLPGQTLVLPFYPRLPASVTKITSMTNAQVQMRLTYDDGRGKQSKLERRDFQFRGLNEIEYGSMAASEIVSQDDAFDLAELNAAWVTEEDAAVKAYYAKISELSGGFGMMSNGKELEQLGRSVYNYMLNTGMTYSGTKGVPEKVGDNWTLVQSMRLPRDIIYNNTGLCVELAILWASIANSAGADTLLVLVPGHCFPVLVAQDGTLLPIEATGILGAGQGNLGQASSFEQAVKQASELFGKARRGETWSMVLRVSQLRQQGIRPPELGDIDRPALIKLLDDRLAKRQQQQQQVANNTNTNPNFDPTNQNRQQQQPDVNVPIGPDRPPQPVQPQPAIPGGQQWQDPQGRIAFMYPATWMRNDQQVQAMRAVFPGYAISVIDPQTACGVDVVFFDGVNDPMQVLNRVQAAYQNMGVQVQIGGVQQTNIGGRQVAMVPVAAMTANGVSGGSMAIIPTRTGMMTFAIGGPQQTMQMAQPSFAQILASVRLGQ